jgi:hypothetical protein
MKMSVQQDQPGQIVLVSICPPSGQGGRQQPFVPSCDPPVVRISSPETCGDAFPVYYILDQDSVDAGYYIAGFFAASPFTREYLRGSPSIKREDIQHLQLPCEISAEQLFTGFSIPNINHRQALPVVDGARPEWLKLVGAAYSRIYPIPPAEVDVDITLVIQNFATPQIQILFDPQDQDGARKRLSIQARCAG